MRREPRWQLSLDAELGRHIGSKTEAEAEAAKIRAAILAGTFERAAQRLARKLRQTECGPATSAGIALDAFARIYVDRASKPSGKVSWAKDASMFDRFCAYRSTDERALGQWPLPSITEDVIEAFFASLSDFAASTRNKYVQLLRASFRWAVKKGYLAHSPISDDSALKRTKAAQRRRRISLEEEKALLDAASPARMGPDPLKHGAGLRLQWLIIAAIETGCRLGELLALQWGDVDWSKRTVLVRAVERGAKKTGRSCLLPMSARLSATLDMAKTDPAGRQYPPAAYVFGQLGARVRHIKKAWETCVLRAHGHEPQWTKRTHGLTEESRAAFRAVDLHFHDLRHEAGCRWLEAGWPIHHVQEMLGHTNLSQTSTYLHAAERGLQESMRRYDAARAEGPVADVRGNPVVNEATRERAALHHAEAEKASKDLLH
jgi:integrase